MTSGQKELQIGQIATREQIHKLYGGSPYSGGICPAVDEKNVLVFSDHEVGVSFGYHDGWLAEGDELGKVFEYTGAGQRGPMEFGGRTGKGNAAVLHHQDMNRRLLLFIAVPKPKGLKAGAKQHRYVGEFYLDPKNPYEVRPALDVERQERLAIVFRLRPMTDDVALVPEDMVPPAKETKAQKIPLEVTESRLVPPEQSRTAESRRAPTSAIVAKRREAGLCAAFEEYLAAQEHDVRRLQIRIKGKTSTLITDLYDATAHVLYEAKGSSSREAVRMALGQLLDYRRFAHTDENPEDPRCAVLLPELPDQDLQELLASHDIAIVHRAGDDFLEVPATR
ncbi:hypothetical protein [Kitasatospora sp. NBC_01266]|uniref:hypothetical protein n=1 Tax=Kitasatospora sp. NBC_01266 TaxID=2903572 RepID=UPI002E341F2A|nr:hypothetical protein [Kitasatospora sp. NBC_01266]